MTRRLRWRTLILAAIVLVCGATLLPTLAGRDLPEWYPFDRTIDLGLDLEGGSHVVYSIDLDQAVADRASVIKRDLDTQFEEEGIAATITLPQQPAGALTVVPQEPGRRDEIAARIARDYGDTLESRDCPPGSPPGAICLRVSTRYAEAIRRSALTTAVNIIRERIDARGVAEPSVVEKGDEIIVEMPGLDPALIAETRSLIARTAKLELKVVDEASEYMQRLYARITADTPDPRATELGIRGEVDLWNTEAGEQRVDFYLIAPDRRESLPIATARELGCPTSGRGVEVQDGMVSCVVRGSDLIDRYVAELGAADPTFRIPEDRQLVYELVEPATGEPFWRSYFVHRAVELTGASIENVDAGFDPNTGRPIVMLDFTRAGGRVFGDLTERIVGSRLATILDGRVRSAPVINEPIRGGRATITLGGGDPSAQEAERDALVDVLRTGSLPAPLREESVSQVGPTLGQDAIDRAQLAFLIAVLIVVALLVGIYRVSGALALVTLTLNVMFVLTLLVVFDATLTLPGIAGIVLTFGMAVDGNIIIYERIREELDRHKSVRGAVDIGYSRAFSAIIDGQLTTMAGGLVLLVYGTGPIVGFAVTLIMGNVTALFANIWCTRVLYDHYLSFIARRNKPLSI